MKTANKIMMPNGEEIGIDGLYGKLTNCLLEVPQRIKYTLDNGTLTIHAGSVVIVPYGTEDLTAQYPVGSTFLNDNFKVYDTQFADGKFFVWAELVGDMSFGEAYTSSVLCYMVCDLAFNAFRPLATVDTNLAYDTSTNLVQHANIPGGVMTLPVGLGYRDTTGISSVTQTFNGMGYIGSTVWVDKGVKGLIPNGRNEDGTLKNKEAINTKLVVFTIPDVHSDCRELSLEFNKSIGSLYKPFIYRQESEPNIPDQFVFWYNPVTNIFKFHKPNGTWEMGDIVFIGTYMCNPIATLTPKLPFRAVDYSDKAEVSGWSMPSNKYIDLTLGASETSYTAPANGWFSLQMFLSANPNTSWGAQMSYHGTNMGVGGISTAFIQAQGEHRMIMPVRKGEKVRIRYAYASTYGNSVFQFYYAEGEV